MKVSVQYAREHFEDLVSAVDQGQSVEIERPEKAPLRLVPSSTSPVQRTGKRNFGAGEGLIQLPSDEEWKVMDKEIAEEMLDAPVYPQSRT